MRTRAGVTEKSNTQQVGAPRRLTLLGDLLARERADYRYEFHMASMRWSWPAENVFMQASSV